MNKDKNRMWLHRQIGSYFKTARINAGVTQTEIAKHLNVTPQYICNYENGSSGSGTNLIRAFVLYYKMSPNKVLQDISSIQKKYLEAELNGSKLKIL